MHRFLVWCNRSPKKTLCGVKAFLKQYGKWFLLLFGVVAIAMLVRSVGIDAMARIIKAALPFLPILFLLEGLWISMDVFALRALMGSSQVRMIPKSTWIRASFLAYGIMILFPAGRAGAEVARASLFAKHIGGFTASAHAVRLQACTLFANTFISIPCALVVSLKMTEWNAAPQTTALFWSVVGNAVVTGVLGYAVYLLCIGKKGFLVRLAEKTTPKAIQLTEQFKTRVSFVVPVLLTCLGRMIQTVQYGVFVLAVGGAFGVVPSFMAEAIHLVGAGLGDLVPNQAGITEGAYRIFASSLGFEQAPAKALGIALLARLVQSSLALFALMTSLKGKDSMMQHMRMEE